jgi:hypothetical protein
MHVGLLVLKFNERYPGDWGEIIITRRSLVIFGILPIVATKVKHGVMMIYTVSFHTVNAR